MPGEHEVVLPGGVRVNMTPEEAARHEALGAKPADVGTLALEQADARQREAVNTWDDKLSTFVEGAADALTLGLVRERGELADLRRDVNSGAAFAGELAGTMLGLKIPGPTAWGAKAGEKAGEALAAGLGSGKLVSRVAHEAGVGAALAGAGALGHQAFDALIEHKDFAAEAVVHDLGIGTILGGAVGLFGAGLGRFTKGDVAAQGGLLAKGSVESKTLTGHVQSAVDAIDREVDQHAVRLGLARGLADEGKLPPLLEVEGRAKALDATRKARARLGDVAKGLDKADPKFFEALDEYQLAARNLDDKMVLQDSERLRGQHLGRVEDVPGYGVKPFTAEEEVGVGPTKASNDLDARMASPENRARYRELFGREWEPVPGAEPEVQPKSTAPSTQEKTGAQTPKARAATPAREPYFTAADEASPTLLEDTAPTLHPEAPKTLVSESPVPEGERPTMFDPVAGRRMRPADLAELIKDAKLIEPSAKAAAEDNLLHGEVGDRPLLKLKSGYFMPQATIDANPEFFQANFPSLLKGDPRPVVSSETQGEAFARFLDKLNTTRVESVRTPPIEAARTMVDGAPTTVDAGRGDLDALNAAVEKIPPRKVNPEDVATKGRAKAAVKQWIDDWYVESRKLGPRVSPGDQAAARIAEAVDKVYQATGGRADAVATLELGPKYGLPEPRTPLTERAQQAVLLRKVADEVRNLASGAAKPGSPAGKWLKRRFFGKAGAAVAGGLVGGHLAGSAGYLLGASLAGGYSDLAGRMASSAGRMMTRVARAAEALTSGHKLTAATTLAVNKPYAYSEAGPITDPVERILDLKRAAQNPEALKAQVRSSLGDLVAVHPALAASLEQAAVNRVTALSVRAPAIYFDRLGNPTSPGSQAMRHWFEYENAAHAMDRVVDDVAAGRATDVQLTALRELAPVTHQTLVQLALQNHDRLADLPRPALHYLERVTGLPMTRSSDPGMVARNQMAVTPSPTMGGAGPGQGKPQAFKINQNSLATQAQGAPSGRAPGN